APEASRRRILTLKRPDQFCDVARASAAISPGATTTSHSWPREESLRTTSVNRRGPPSMLRAELSTALSTRQGVNMLRHATFSGFARSLASLVFGANHHRTWIYDYSSLDSRGTRL